MKQTPTESVIKKLNALRKTLSKEEQDVLDRIVLAATAQEGEVTAHGMTPRPAPRPAERLAGRQTPAPTPRPETGPDEVVAHGMQTRPETRPETRPWDRPQGRNATSPTPRLAQDPVTGEYKPQV